MWRDSRRVRITASTASKVPKRKTTNPDKFLREKMFPTFKGNNATRHGQVEEGNARAFYAEHFGVVVEDKGSLLKSGMQWLSASPDGIINNTEIIEIKCPVVDSLDAMIDGGKYDVRKGSDGVLFLAPNGSRGYYQQVQLTMYCCEVKACKFFLWKNKDDYKVIDVKIDENYVSSVIKRLEEFYFVKFLPRIVDDSVANRTFCSKYLELCQTE